METADAVVVGAGLNGAATAFFLLRAGLRRVVILDAGLPNAGASGAAVGLLRTHYDNRPETEIAAASMPWFREWAERIGGDCGWMQTGFYRFVEPDELDNMRANVAVQREFGVEVEIIDPADLARRAPEFDHSGIGAVLLEPQAGTADNAKATTSLLKAASAIGGELRPYRRATGLLTAAGRVTGVETDKGAIAAPVVVLAAGAGCREIAATAGIDLPLQARAISAAAVIGPPDLRIPGSYMDPVTNSWVTPREQGQAIIAAPHGKSGKPADPATFDREFGRECATDWLGPVARRLPAMAGATLANWWWRADCYAPDGKPLVGAVGALPGLFLNTAGAGKGHKVAPALAIGLAELIAEGAAKTVDLSPFGMERFSGPAYNWGNHQYRHRVIG